jgi:16S rRNA C967 or C1407 C5-methylase (RsmB/RsmF family)
MQHPNKSGLSKEGEQKEWGGNEDTAKMTEVENEKTSLSPAMGSLPTLQRALLLRAASAVKPGGRLVYATCSVIDVERTQSCASMFE